MNIWFGLAKVSIVNFSQIKLFFAGSLAREFVHFAMNYSVGSFFETFRETFSRFGKRENFMWRNSLIDCFTGFQIIIGDSPSINFQISSSHNLWQ